MHTDWPITQLWLGADGQLVLRNDHGQIAVHRIDVSIATSPTVTAVAAFGTDAAAGSAADTQLFAGGAHLYAVRFDGVHIISAGGVRLRTIALGSSNAAGGDGRPIGAHLDAAGRWLTVFTARGSLCVYDTQTTVSSSAGPRSLLVAPKSAYDVVVGSGYGGGGGGRSFGEVIAARCNANGTMVALTAATEQLRPDGRLYVWSVESDAVAVWSFADERQLGVGADAAATAMSARMPMHFCWDEDDPRLLACETRALAAPHAAQVNVMFVGAPASTVSSSSAAEERAPTTTTTGDNMQLHHLEELALDDGERLVSVCVPHVVTLRGTRVERRALRDFGGMPEGK